MKSDREHWDKKYRGKERGEELEASPFLRRHIHNLPRGKALDLAAGEGRNAIFLAQQGFEVTAVDISRIALARAGKLARDQGVSIQTIPADLDTYAIQKGLYDLISVFNFLDRHLIRGIKGGLKMGGKVVFETYTMEQISFGDGLKNRKYLLKPNELLQLFKDFRILFYREGVFGRGRRKKAMASLLAEKI